MTTALPSTCNVQPQTIIDVLRQRAAAHPHRIAYTFIAEDGTANQAVTYGDLLALAESVASALRQQGQDVGDRVLLMYPPGLAFVAGLYGCLAAGAVAVPIYPPRSNRHVNRVEAVMLDAGATLALTADSMADKIRGFFAENPATRKLSVLGTDFLPLASSATSLPHVVPESLAVLQYTSGSTGKPKGVIVTHANIMANLHSVLAADPKGEEMVMVSWLPIFHDMGLFGCIIRTVYLGGQSILIPPSLFAKKPEMWLTAASDFQATQLGAPNFGYALAVKTALPSNLSLSSIQTAWNGAEPIRPEVLDSFSTQFAAHGWRPHMHFPCYGLAEATLMVTAHRHGLVPKTAEVDSAGLERGEAILRPGGRRLVSCGICHAETRLRIVDPETARPLPERRVGEIWVEGPSVAAGYWRNEAETQRVFRARTAMGEGPFLRTGDLGFLHEGELYVTGRLKDMVKIRGRNLYPQDVERCLEDVLEQEGPNSVAVFALDDGSQERLAAVIEGDRAMVRAVSLANGTRVPSLDALVGRLRAAVTGEFDVVLHDVVFVRPGSFPRTSSGKVQRSLTRRQLQEGTLMVVYADRPGTNGGNHGLSAVQFPTEGTPWGADVQPAPEGAGTSLCGAGGDVSALAAVIQTALVGWMAEERGFTGDSVDPRASFASLGVDSLGGAQVALEIEKRTGLLCSPEELYDHQSVEELSQYLQAHGRRAAQRDQPQEVIRRPAPARPRVGDPLARYREGNSRANRWRAAGRYFFAPEITEQSNAWIQADGKRMLVLGSYGYLGLLRHDKLDQAATQAIAEFGTGHHGVRLLAGTTVLHRRLEAKLAEVQRAEDALVYSSGYVTNVATITALVGPGDMVIGDEWNHASLIDGCRFSGAHFQEFKHNNMADLRAKLEQSGGAHTLVVVDGVYSMEGDIARLPEIVPLCREFGALLMVDEAHSFGVLGRTGCGVQEHFHLPPDAIDVKMGTLSKALGSSGGYVAGQSELIQYLRHHARGYIFSGALPVAEVVAAEAAITLLKREPERVARLWRNRERFATGLKRAGFHTFGSETPIVPIATRTEELTLEMTRLCRENGLFVVPVFYPAVPMNAPRLRTCVMASHTDDDIDFAVRVLEDAAKATGLVEETSVATP